MACGWLRMGVDTEEFCTDKHHVKRQKLPNDDLKWIDFQSSVSKSRFSDTDSRLRYAIVTSSALLGDAVFALIPYIYLASMLCL